MSIEAITDYAKLSATEHLHSPERVKCAADRYLEYLLRMNPDELAHFAICLRNLQGTKYGEEASAAVRALRQFGIDATGDDATIAKGAIDLMNRNYTEGLPQKSDIPPLDLKAVAQKVRSDGIVATVEFNLSNFWNLSADPDMRELMRFWHVAQTGTLGTEVRAVVPEGADLSKITSIQPDRSQPAPDIIFMYPGFANTADTFVPVLQALQYQALREGRVMVGWTIGTMGSGNTLAPDDLRILFGHDPTVIPYSMTGNTINAVRAMTGMLGLTPDEQDARERAATEPDQFIAEIGWSMGAIALLYANAKNTENELRRLGDPRLLPPSAPLKTEKRSFCFYWTPAPNDATPLVNAVPRGATPHFHVQGRVCDTLVRTTMVIGRGGLDRLPGIASLVNWIAGHLMGGEAAAAQAHAGSLLHGPEVKLQRNTLRKDQGVDPATALYALRNYRGMVVYAKNDKITPRDLAALSMRAIMQRAIETGTQSVPWGTVPAGSEVPPLPEIDIPGGHGELFRLFRAGGFTFLRSSVKVQPASARR
ncbi:MAG: hypothetical protein N2691_02340 [Patescibacteria group bacterium]|nr:hypothetical protein [Patescibacteria group bacterium]